MKIVINAIENKNNLIFVCAETGIGKIKGVWNDKAIPQIGKEYFIELSIKNFHNSIAQFCNKNTNNSVTVKSDIILFVGCCESIDEEVYYIRFDTDWLEMIEIPDNNPKIEIGDYVFFSVQCRDILFYPYEIF